MARTQTRGYGARDARKVDAKRRNGEWQLLSSSQKMASLDNRLGVGVGAKRQRAKLSREIK